MSEKLERAILIYRFLPGSRSTGIAADIRTILSRPRAGLPLYRHCMPRTPLALQELVFNSRRVQAAISKACINSGAESHLQRSQKMRTSLALHV